jgi:uncharacterized membrane protein
MNKRTIQNTAVIVAAIAAVITVIDLSTDWFSASRHEKRERCYGIVRAAKNDCATAKHSCAAQATVDGAPEEYIMLPKGLCERIVGGRSG